MTKLVAPHPLCCLLLTFCTIPSPHTSVEDNCDFLIEKFWETEVIQQAKPVILLKKSFVKITSSPHILGFKSTQMTNF